MKHSEKKIRRIRKDTDGPGPHGLGYWPDGRPVKSGVDALRYQQTQGGFLDPTYSGYYKIS